jgi:hypothetical protein
MPARKSSQSGVVQLGAILGGSKGAVSTMPSLPRSGPVVGFALLFPTGQFGLSLLNVK